MSNYCTKLNFFYLQFAMKINIENIPNEGLNLNFETKVEHLNQRFQEVKNNPVPTCVFISPIKANFFLKAEGRTVEANGQATSTIETDCSRCAEKITKELSTNIRIILKPTSARASVGEEDEDLSIGYYDGKEINLAEIAEEFLTLAIPFTILCSENCHGLCPLCGTNLNITQCNCQQEKNGDTRFAILKSIKIE